MKSKLTLAFLMTCIALTLGTHRLYAANLTLDRIGGFDLGGKTYSEWWYTGINPTFYGTADVGDTISLSVDDEIYNDTVDSAGNWSVYVPLTMGNYQISITNGSDTYAFTLHLGQEFPTGTTVTETTSSTMAATVPTTGINQTTAILFGTGISLLALYFYFFESSKKRVVFERDILSD